jgi:hypothetical protein
MLPFKSMRRFITPISATAFLLVVISAVGCDKPTPQAPPQVAPTASLADQKLCAEGAEKSFTAEKKAFRYYYTNHLDPLSKTCYVETTETTLITPLPYRYEYGHTIYDAFEGRVYGEFLSDSARGTPDDCSIEPRDQPKVACKTQEEFDQLALRYFGTTPD